MDKKVDIALDQEWIVLIKEALQMGISKEEITVFFMENAKKR